MEGALAFLAVGAGFLRAGLGGDFFTAWGAALDFTATGFMPLGGVFTGLATAFALGGAAAFLADWEGFVLFCGLCAGWGLVFEEVDFVFKLLSFRPVQRAGEHQPRGFSGQEFVFGFFACRRRSRRDRRFRP